MKPIEIKIVANDLKLSKQGFFSVFDQFKKKSRTAEEAYIKCEEYCELNGYALTFASFGSFKFAYFVDAKNNGKRKKKVRNANRAPVLG